MEILLGNIICLEFVRPVLGGFLEVLGGLYAGILWAIGGFRRNLGGFTAGSFRFSVDSRRMCSGLLVLLALAGIELNFWSSGGPEAAKMVTGWPKRWPKGAQGVPKTMKK